MKTEVRESGLGKKAIKSGLKDSIVEGSATGAASGIISTYLTPFALALGASASQIGLLFAIPQLFSTILQPLAGSLVEHVSSRKSACRHMQIIARAAWIPVIMLAFLSGFDRFSVLLLFVTVSAAAASFARVAWASWMGELVPEKIRGAYFGKRNMFIGAASFAAVFFSGWLLGMSDTLAGFVIIFLMALALYAAAQHYLLKVPEIRISPGAHRRHKVSLNMSEFLSSMKRTNFKRFMIFAMLFDFSVYLAAPFFTVYMISELQISYWWFAVISSASIVAGMLSQKYWGKISDRYGDRNVMMICAALASLVPLIFIFSRDVPLLVLANVFSGFAWAGLDLVTFNFLLDSSPPLKRPLFISNYQFFDGLAVAGGSLAGGAIIYFAGSGFIWLSAIGLIFAISFLLRAVFSALLIPRIREERIRGRKMLPAKEVFKRAVVLYPVLRISHEIDYAHHCLTCWEKKAKKEMKGLSKIMGMV
jgi:MFS family permease